MIHFNGCVEPRLFRDSRLKVDIAAENPLPRGLAERFELPGVGTAVGPKDVRRSAVTRL
jgi:hypothetical protein